MSQSLQELGEQMRIKNSPPHDFVQTSPCGRGQRHIHGFVGKLWRIQDPESVRIGCCFLAGRLKKDDLFLCIEHSGDCFQTYMYVEEYSNCLIGRKEWNFGSYGIGDAKAIEISVESFNALKDGGDVDAKDFSVAHQD